MPIETWIEPSGLFGMGAGPVSPITNVATQGAAQGAASGLININPLVSGAMLAYNLYRGLSDRQKAESQKRDNLFYLTLDEMRKAGKDPYEQYPEDLFDVSQYPEFAGIAPSGSPEEMRRETINAAIYNWRERNQDIVQQAYDAFLRSGLDYDEYKKRLEEGEPVEEEEEDIFTDTTAGDTTQTEIIDDKTDEPTLADIIGGWLERQTGPVTQERIRGVLDRYGKTVGDFNEAVADVEGIPEFEDFVTEADLATPPPDVVGGTTVTGDPAEPVVTGPTELPPPDEKKEEEDYVDLNAPKPQLPTPGLPQQPTTEPEPTQQGMFAFAASPNRTTSEVLAPDLFKIDANIPLVGRLTQARPMAAPQYLLSGISQRYKV